MWEFLFQYLVTKLSYVRRYVNPCLLCTLENLLSRGYCNSVTFKPQCFNDVLQSITNVGGENMFYTVT